MSGYLLSVGDIDLVISWNAHLLKPGTPNNRYHDFLHAREDRSTRQTIDCAVIEGEAGVAPQRPLFTCSAWTLYLAGNDKYLLRLHSLGKNGREKMDVVLGRDFNSASIYCNADLINDLPPGFNGLRLTHYPLDQFLFMNLLVDRRGMLIHSAGGDIQGRGIVFPAVSGGGKSTLSRLLAPVKGNTLFSDDRMIIRQERDGWQAYGTPWHGEEKIALNRKIPLAALVFLVHAETTEVRPIAGKDALHALMRVCSIPWYDSGRVQKSFDFCEQLLAGVPLFELRFRPDRTAADALEQLVDSLTDT